MKRLFRLLFCLSLTVPAFGQAVCDRSASISAAAAASATVATGVANQSIRICGFLITGNTASTGVQFLSGSTAMSGVMLTPANGPLTVASSTPMMSAAAGATVTVACTTGACTGFVSFTQY